MQLKIDDPGLCIDGKKVLIYKIGSNNGFSVQLTNLGATVLSILLPKKGGGTDDILLGFDKLESILKRGPMFGTTIGRCAGKIKDARMVINGNKVELTKSHGEHHAHGGFRGFDKRVFSVPFCTDNSVKMAYFSMDGEEGYPGNLDVEITFTVTENKLNILYQAISDKDTVVSMTNHMYFNLCGHDNGDILGHTVRIPSGKVVNIDSEKIPDERLISTAGTPLDLRNGVLLGRNLTAEKINSCPLMKLVGGYDYDYLIDNASIPSATLSESSTGRKMEIYSDMPYLHFYAADFSNYHMIGKDGVSYEGRCGVCFEPQYAANSVNTGLCPSPLLYAGDVYKSNTRMVFTW